MANIEIVPLEQRLSNSNIRSEEAAANQRLVFQERNSNLRYQWTKDNLNKLIALVCWLIVCLLIPMVLIILVILIILTIHAFKAEMLQEHPIET